MNISPLQPHLFKRSKSIYSLPQTANKIIRKMQSKLRSTVTLLYCVIWTAFCVWSCLQFAEENRLICSFWKDVVEVVIYSLIVVIMDVSLIDHYGSWVYINVDICIYFECLCLDLKNHCDPIWFNWFLSMLQTSIIAVEIASKGTRIELQLRWTVENR